MDPEAARVRPLEDLDGKDVADGDDKVLAEDLGLAGGHLLPVVEDAEEDAASLHLAAPVQLPVVVDV